MSYENNWGGKQPGYRSWEPGHCPKCGSLNLGGGICESCRFKENQRGKGSSGTDGGLVLIIIACLIISAVVGFVLFQFRSVSVNLFGETNAMNICRNEKGTTYIKKGVEIEREQIDENKTALIAFMENCNSYRYEGTFAYGIFKDGKHTAYLSVNLNYENEIYYFQIKNKYNSGNQKLQKFIIPDGDYTITENSKNDKYYGFLMEHIPKNIIKTNFLDNCKGYNLWYCDYYYTKKDNATAIIFGDSRTDLKVYRNKPLYYFYRHKDDKTQIEYEYKLEIFYDKSKNEKEKQ